MVYYQHIFMFIYFWIIILFFLEGYASRLAPHLIKENTLLPNCAFFKHLSAANFWSLNWAIFTCTFFFACFFPFHNGAPHIDHTRSEQEIESIGDRTEQWILHFINKQPWDLTSRSLPALISYNVKQHHLSFKLLKMEYVCLFNFSLTLSMGTDVKLIRKPGKINALQPWHLRKLMNSLQKQPDLKLLVTVGYLKLLVTVGHNIFYSSKSLDYPFFI